MRISFFGVYDGHGGDKVAIYTGEHLHKIIAKQEAFKNKNFETTWTWAAEEVDDSDIEEQIKEGQAESTKTNGEQEGQAESTKTNGEQEGRVQREGPPGAAEEPTKDSSSTATPEEPKIKAATDGPATEEAVAAVARTLVASFF